MVVLMTIPRKLAFMLFVAVPMVAVFNMLRPGRDGYSYLELTDERVAMLIREEREQNYKLFGCEEPRNPSS